MTIIARELADTLASIQRPGSFYASGTVDIHPPRLEVKGVGTIALPLLPVQAEELIAIAERAPYGLATETLIDTDVRRTWQIGSEQVGLSGKAWDQDLATMVSQSAAGLGVSGPVEVELYKLLIYDTGSFFVRHRDSEKKSGMFATMVVVLPGEYSGGELRIRHQGQEVQLDLHRDEPSEAAFAAFYADCVHEVLPVASGYRLALIYNLLRAGKGSLPKPPDYGIECKRVTRLLRGWAREQDSGAESEPVPTKLIYPLEHAYTQAELDFGALKGADSAVASVIVEAARDADCELYLGLVSIEESGTAEHVGSGYRGGPDDFEACDVEDGSQRISELCHPDGGQHAFGSLPFEIEELSPPGVFEEMDPEDLNFHEATGNEGATFDRLYQCAGLVLWPRSQRISVIAQGGLVAMVPYLGELAAQWQSDADQRDDMMWPEAHELAARIRREWPETTWERMSVGRSGLTAALLAHLVALGDRQEIDSFLSERIATGAYGKDDSEGLAAALGCLSPTRARGLLLDIITHNAARLPVACTSLLARCAVTIDESAQLLHPVALALFQALPGQQESVTTDHYPTHPEAPTVKLVVDLLCTLESIEPPLAREAVDFLRSHPDHYPLDGVLVPAALELNELADIRNLTSVAALRLATLAHLRQRTAEPLEPPADWSRPSDIACLCTYCRDLSRFLKDASSPTWMLKAGESKRRHVEESISKNRCDLETSTETRGRPYTLVCTKTQASYEQRVRQRQQDIEHLAQLDG